jgi:hypothetical protein
MTPESKGRWSRDSIWKGKYSHRNVGMSAACRADQKAVGIL